MDERIACLITAICFNSQKPLILLISRKKNIFTSGSWAPIYQFSDFNRLKTFVLFINQPERKAKGEQKIFPGPLRYFSIDEKTNGITPKSVAEFTRTRRWHLDL